MHHHISNVMQHVFEEFDKHGTSPTSKCRNKILNCATQKKKKDVQCFLGLVNWLHRFIDHLYLLVHPLIKLTQKDKPFKWCDEQQEAFNKVKTDIQQPHFQHHPHTSKTFHLFCDASEHEMRGLLTQKNDKT